MRKYGTVAPTFWTRGSGKSLRGDPPAQLLALYLMTCPSSNFCGIWYLPTVIMAHDTGLPQVTVDAALMRLAVVDLAHYDDATELVWVPGMAHWQLGPELKLSDNRRYPLIEDLVRVGNHRFVQCFFDRYAVAYNLTPDVLVAKGVAKGLQEGLPLGVWEGSSRTRTLASHDHEHEHEQDTSRTPSGPPDQPTVSKKPHRGRAPRSVIPTDWSPPADVLAELTAAGLDADAVVADFIGYWRNDGKLGADWLAAFRNNVRKIHRTDFLRDRFATKPPPSGRAPKVSPTTAPVGPPAPPPEGLLDRLNAAAAARTPAFLRDSGPPSHDVAPGTRLTARTTPEPSENENASTGQPVALAPISVPPNSNQ